METRQQGRALMSALCLFIGIVLVVQLWLLSAAVDAFLSGDAAVLVPATIASVALLAVNGGLLAYGISFDRRIRRVPRG
ncbi:MAG TPA: DUF6755 family protein [Polyangia bacterium]